MKELLLSAEVLGKLHHYCGVVQKKCSKPIYWKSNLFQGLSKNPLDSYLGPSKQIEVSNVGLHQTRQTLYKKRIKKIKAVFCAICDHSYSSFIVEMRVQI